MLDIHAPGYRIYGRKNQGTNKKGGDIAVTALFVLCFTRLLSKSFNIFLNTFCLICCNIGKRYLLFNKISSSFSDKSPE